MLVVSHDRYFLDCVATRIVELNNAGIVTFKGNYSSFLLQQKIRLEFMQKEKLGSTVKYSVKRSFIQPCVRTE